MNIAVLIPAYRPEPQLVELLRALALVSRTLSLSTTEAARNIPLFSRRPPRSQRPSSSSHRNRGKGDAPKTGLSFILGTLPSCTGSHRRRRRPASSRRHPEGRPNAWRHPPARSCLEPDSLTDTFHCASRLGNITHAFALRWIGGARLTDSQTGLRGIPRALIAPLLENPSNGYEFELTCSCSPSTAQSQS